MSSSRISKEESSTPSDETLEKVNSYIKEAFDLLKHETNRVRMEKEALDEAAKKLEHVHFSKMVKLNVGGHFFSTSLETLTKDAGTPPLKIAKVPNVLYLCLVHARVHVKW